MRQQVLRPFGFGLALTLFLGSFAAGADDVDTGQAFNRVSLKGRKELDKALSDPNLGVKQKVQAIRRLGELAKDLAASPGIPAADLYNPVLGVLSLSSSKYEILRKAACETLYQFSDHEGSESLVKPLGAVLNNKEETNDVRIAASISLGRFSKDKTAASDELVRALNDLVSDGARGDNVRLTASVINGVGRLRDKRSFVPLMRVIQSNFPTTAKQAAQRALENIDWER